ncbi:acyl-CoA dehydrogenase family protein [Streptomyces sp. NPDC059355]|uniref:acyl-CoA dehydrogenase family protein n=1 Tax=Streptomyces sp. NPDC059355 TaxID=3346811 RepID=UPI0036740843
MNFDSLPDELEKFRNQVFEFVQESIAPRVLELDAAPADGFDWELVEQGHALGLTRVAIPRDFGGLGLGMPGTAVALEEMASVCAVNGRKRFITNTQVARFASVFANMEGTPGATGLTSFMVTLDSPGVTRGPVADKMGYRLCLGSELIFEDVRVPVENRVGAEGDGMRINMAQSNMARAAVAGISTGVARGALEMALNGCGTRVQGGRQLQHHQFTAAKLAEMTAKVDASRLLYLKAAHKADNELPAPQYEPAVAKLFADRTAIEVADLAMSLAGARGYLRSFDGKAAEGRLRRPYLRRHPRGPRSRDHRVPLLGELSERHPRRAHPHIRQDPAQRSRPGRALLTDDTPTKWSACTPALISGGCPTSSSVNPSISGTTTGTG